MSELNFAAVPELRPYQNKIYGVMSKVPGLSNAGLMWAPLSGRLVRIRKSEQSPETYLVLFEEVDSSSTAPRSAAESIAARQQAIRTQGTSLGLAGLGVIAGAVGLVAAAGTLPFVVAGVGLAAASYGFGIALGKTSLALEGNMDHYDNTLASEDLQSKEFWSDLVGLVAGGGAAALALKGATNLARIKSTLEAMKAAASIPDRAAILSRLTVAQKTELIEFIRGLKHGQVLKHTIPGKAGLSFNQRIDSIIKGIELAHGATGRKQAAVNMIHAPELVSLMKKAILAEWFGQKAAVGSSGTQSMLSGAAGTISDKLSTPFGTIEVALPVNTWTGIKTGNSFVIALRDGSGKFKSVKSVGWTIFQRPSH